MEKRYRLEVELDVDGNHFLHGYLNDLHKSSFSPNQFITKYFYLDITSQLLPYTLAHWTRNAAGG